MQRRQAAAIALGAAGAAAAGGGWLVLRALDRRAIRADPEYPTVFAPLAGRPVPVTAPDGTELHVEVFGPDHGPTIVLTHGWTCSLRFWTYQIQALAPDVRVVAWDLRGHGKSAVAASGDYSIDAFGDDLEAVLGATVPEGERAVLAGHSMGGMTIVSWAGRHPEAVERRAAAVALVSTGMGDLMSESLVVRSPERFARANDWVGTLVLSARAPLPHGPTPLAYRLVRYAALSPTATPAQVALSERLVIDCPTDVRAACAGTLSHLDLKERVHAVTVPAAVLVGERDKLTPPVHAHQLEESLPDASACVEVPRAGHMLPLEAHARVTEVFRELLDRYASPAPPAAAASSSSSTATASSGSTGNGASPASASRSSA
jgi:pimeloyl-ACP methyl ester carboxylesterase